jgi:hypothetical protein
MGGKAGLLSGYQHKCGNFRISPEALRFCLNLLKFEGSVENFNKHQQFFSYFFLSSQTQTGATAPLMTALAAFENLLRTRAACRKTG